MPPITPVTGSIEPVAGLLLVQVPPLTVLVRVLVAPTGSWVTPDIGPGAGFTVTALVAVQPAVEIKVIVAVPADTPHTEVLALLAAPVVATAVLLLVHRPAVTSVSVMHCPAHTTDGPVIAATGFTVMVFVAVQLPMA